MIPGYKNAFILLIISGTLMFYACSSEKSKSETSGQSGLSEELVKANELTEQVFYYVEQVETKKMTQEQANEVSNPIKVELQSLRAKLSREDLMYNDSMRKVLGNIMVDNVMRWRKEQGLIK